MSAFLENPMFFFVDDAESIVPIFHSTEYGNTGRIVELADVGCDPEITFPVHFPHGTSDRRRGGAESLRSTRRIAKYLNDGPNKFVRRARDINNNEDRNRNYIRRKTRQNYYADELDSNDSSWDPYDDLETSRDNLTFGERDNYYTQFVNPQNAIARSRRERIPRYDNVRDRESPFTQSIRVHQRENTSPRWFAESNERNLHEIRDTDVQSSKRKKRTKTLSRTSESFNRETEFEKAEIIMHREQDDLPNAAHPAESTRNTFWDFISFENNVKSEEIPFYNQPRTKNHSRLQKMTPGRRRSYVFDSQPKRVDIVSSEEEEEFKETLRRDSRDTINMKPHSATEERKIKSPTTEGKKERTSATQTIVDDRRHCYKFVNKLSNNSSKKTALSTKTIDRVADSKSNGRTYTENKRDNNANSHPKNSKSNETNRIKVIVSQLSPKKKITKNEMTFTSKMTDASAPMQKGVNAKKEGRKFFSRLPVRTWKRLRTKEPGISRAESHTTNGDVSQELRGLEKEITAKSSNHPVRVENNDVREKNCTAANHNGIKRSGRFEAESVGADKPSLASSVLKNIKGFKDATTAAREAHKQRKTKTSVKYHLNRNL